MKNCLFGEVTLTKNADIDKYGYSGYEIRLDYGIKFFIFRWWIWLKYISSSTHIDNKKRDILVLGKGPTQGLEHTLTAEEMYSINFTVTKRNFV